MPIPPHMPLLCLLWPWVRKALKGREEGRDEAGRNSLNASHTTMMGSRSSVLHSTAWWNVAISVLTRKRGVWIGTRARQVEKRERERNRELRFIFAKIQEYFMLMPGLSVVC